MAERALVAIHGNFASGRWWQQLQAEPPAGWRVLAPTLSGFAGTPLTSAVSIPAYAEWLRDWLAGQHIRRPVLLGHSLGGAVALEYAARFGKDGVAGLVLAASAPLGGLVTPEENYPVLEQMRGNRALLSLSLGALFPAGQPSNFAELVEDAACMAPAQYSGNARALAEWQVAAAALPRVPALVLGGELDRLVTPEMVRQQAAELGVPAQVLPQRGHGFPQEDAPAFRQLLTGFLDRLSG
ncbi:2-succinyl-6-hydroxy-2, 4-cyclohexadiene-1-carboxylate synthase [Deinococcus xinjiangensis]|uniref:2-succinyl-6-hydroxy-2, 4-cyclohexadiene-1-carboxylate synthase n=1 Tax=Deinococcus xinjiangensis TaxID=457454 RepID=A0ABP9VHQ5_9DEIO